MRALDFRDEPALRRLRRYRQTSFIIDKDPRAVLRSQYLEEWNHQAAGVQRVALRYVSPERVDRRHWRSNRRPNLAQRGQCESHQHRHEQRKHDQLRLRPSLRYTSDAVRREQCQQRKIADRISADVRGIEHQPGKTGEWSERERDDEQYAIAATQSGDDRDDDERGDQNARRSPTIDVDEEPPQKVRERRPLRIEKRIRMQHAGTKGTHRRHVRGPAGRQDGRSNIERRRDEPRQKGGQRAVAPTAAIHGQDERAETHQSVLYPHGNGAAEHDRSDEECRSFVTAAQQQQRRNDGKRDGRDVAECRAAEQPHIRRENKQQGSADRRPETETDLARQEEQCRKQSARCNDRDCLETAEWIARHERLRFSKRHEKRKARRMRMVFGDVVGAHCPDEKHLVPIPRRPGSRKAATQGASDRQEPECYALAVRHAVFDCDRRSAITIANSRPRWLVRIMRGSAQPWLRMMASTRSRSYWFICMYGSFRSPRIRCTRR